MQGSRFNPQYQKQKWRWRQTAGKYQIVPPLEKINLTGTSLITNNQGAPPKHVGFYLFWSLSAHSTEPISSLSMKDSPRTSRHPSTAVRGKMSKIKQTEVETERKKINHHSKHSLRAPTSTGCFQKIMKQHKYTHCWDLKAGIRNNILSLRELTIKMMQ